MDNTLDNTNKLILKVFSRMFLGLLATAIVALFTFYSGAVFTIPYGVICVAELVVVVLFNFLFRKLPPVAVTILYFIYAILTGVTFSTLFVVFDMSTLIYAFFATAALFGILAAVGYFAKADISKFSTVFTVGLIIGIILSIVNLIMGNTILEIILDWFILLLFCGITIYDVNKIKNIDNYAEIENQEKIYVYGAMELYLDFINIFVRILSIVDRFRSRD